MPGHDRYGKRVLSKAVGDDWIASGETLLVDFGAGPVGRLDGIVRSRIAVKIESREPKQVRGAVLDLVFHTAPKKLLVLIPAYNEPRTMKPQSQLIMSEFLNKRRFRIVALLGRGGRPRLALDVQRVRRALRELGWRPK
jgi:hypothetical protein